MASQELEVRTPEQLEELLFEGPEQTLYDDPVEAQRAILRRIFAAQSPAELRSATQATPWQEMMEIPVEVRTVKLRESRFKEGSAVFAVVDAVRLDTGETVTLTCSGMNVLGVLMQHQRMGWLPWCWKLTTAKHETAAGFLPLWLSDEGLTQPEPAA